MSVGFVKHFWIQLRRGDLQLVAAGLSYATVLAIIPFIAVGLATLQWVDALDFIYPKVEAFILSYFQGSVGSEGLQLIKKAILGIQRGRVGAVGAVGLFLTSTFLLSKIEMGMHRIWNLKNKRPLYRRIFLHWIFLIAFPFALAVFVALTSTKILISVLPLIVWHSTALFFLLVLLYKFVPCVRVKWWTAFVCSALATTGLLLLFSSFKFITKTFLLYNKIYGSLAAIPIFLIFVLLVWYIILFGTSLSVALNGRTREHL